MASVILPSKADLTQFYVGKDIADVPKPAAVLDVAIIRRHCERMKRTIEALGVGFRAHVKSHKTAELTAMQVDSSNAEAKFIVSTLLELETLMPLLQDLKQRHRINVLYGIPLIPSHVTRLAQLAAQLGEDSVSVMIDHPDQVPYLEKFSAAAQFPACLFVKVDTGYHRAGLPPVSLNKNGLLEKLARAEGAGHARLLGLYSHSSLSYGATTAEEAMAYLIEEIRGCKDALNRWVALLPKDRDLVISVGATPQVASSNNLVQESGLSSPEAKELMALLRTPCAEQSEARVKIELHAGNYPVLDMQQVSTHARIGAGTLEDEIALSVVAEVCSVYNDGEREKPEALIAAGTLALAREPCASYPGWGVLSSWRQEADLAARRLTVERISQEHGIVTWDSGDQQPLPLRIGQVVKVFPNHACVTGAFYGWYFVVDSDSDPGASQIVDIWVRGRAPGAV
ncbi:uncharacterized protein N7459_007046 [Penicillium hispanicum]|uniref:uncharacterized protein n=1 Tax=Penicillium hispanicum TaxID=1080232 RepID=UPI0025410F6F|nr:uncharacterized protein N7459_007046 [Penicillium hispanicum]KAJ5578082.1 hypothetical protein N7459_007046 [Penicillium hispanicum]